MNAAGHTRIDRSVPARQTFAAPLSRVLPLEWSEAAEHAVRLALVAVQLGLLFLVFHLYALEQSSGVLRLAPVLFGGFVVHAFLPARFRLPFFTLLALSCFGVVLRQSALPVFAIAAVLLGICHLPARFAARVALILAAAFGLAIAVASSTLPPVLQGKALPVLGSMFMFRLIIYMYDLRHEREKPSPWMRVAYFFLPPNACFLLFPIVDFQSMRRTYFDREAIAIYQKGVSWIFRGVIHLILYRLVYYYLSPDPAEVAGVSRVALFVVTAWLVYLHVSGLFHVAVGILCLFGFNLPDSHRFYFLAPSPTEVWRRANIYWKDFMTKVLYYPVYKALQKRGVGMKAAVVIATLGVFAATWFLHSYQVFWLLGYFPLSWIHAAFWAVFAVLVLFSTLSELSRPGRRTLAKAAWSARAALAHTIKVMGMFAVMSLMWSWWNTGDTGEWLYLLGTSGESRPIVFGWLALLLFAIAAAGVAVHYMASNTRLFFRFDSDTSFSRAAAVTAAGTLVLLGIAHPASSRVVDPRLAAMIADLRTERLNAYDRRRENRGYYEAIITSGQGGAALAGTRASADPGNVPIRESDAVRKAGGYLEYELKPSHRSVSRGALISTNQWGMRDREYGIEKPTTTWRAALVGASVVMGFQVHQDSTFELRVEERLNRERPSKRFDKFEILNFAVGGYSLLHFVSTVERKVPQFSPDVMILATLGREEDLTRDNLTQRVLDRAPLPPEVASLLARKGIDSDTKESAILRRLKSEEVTRELSAWGYKRIADECRRRGITPVWAYLPATRQPDNGAFERLSRAASEAGFLILDLRDTFDGVDRDAIRIEDDTIHPNAVGHELLARKLYDALMANREPLGLGDSVTVGFGQTAPSREIHGNQ